MFSKICFCKENISKEIRPLLAALSVNGLTIYMNGFNKHIFTIAYIIRHNLYHNLNKHSCERSPVTELINMYINK